MATQPETRTDTAKADAAAEKAYAAAADTVSPKKAEDAPTAAPAKIDAAVAAKKAAPAKAKPAARKAKRVVKKAASAPRTAAAKTTRAPLAASKAVKPVKSAAAPVATKISNLKDKIMATTNTTDFTATVKTMAADAQSKAKAAYDRMQGYAGEMTEFAKGNVEAMVESTKILGAGMQSMARSEVEAAKGAFETATADVKAMVAVKNPTDLFKLQGEIARRNFDAMVAHYSKNAEASMKLAGDAFAPISSRMSLAAEKISKAA